LAAERFTLTNEEWLALGGTPAPDGYDPDKLKRVPSGTKFAMGQQYHKTGLVSALGDVLEIWRGVAGRLGVRLLSIRWPDAHDPFILAEKL
jgi:hypothetical protein